MTYLIRLSALLSALLLLTSPAAGHQPKSISFTEAEAGLTGTGSGSTATDQTGNGHDGTVNGAAWVNNQDANPPEASVYSEDFSDDPEYEVFYENTDGETEVYWDNSSKDFYAKVRDQSAGVWWALGKSPAFTSVTSSSPYVRSSREVLLVF